MQNAHLRRSLLIRASNYISVREYRMAVSLVRYTPGVDRPTRKTALSSAENVFDAGSTFSNPYILIALPPCAIPKAGSG